MFPWYDVTWSILFLLTFILTAILLLRLVLFDGHCRRPLSTRKLSHYLLLLFTAMRFVEYVTRALDIFDAEAPGAMLVFVIPLACLFATFSALLYFLGSVADSVAREADVPFNLHALKLSLAFGNACVGLVGVIASILAAFLHRQYRSDVNAVTNMIIATCFVLVVLFYAAVGYRLQVLGSELAKRFFATAEQLQLLFAPIRRWAMLVALCSVCLLVYAALLIYDAIFLLRFGAFPTGNLAYTEPLPLLIVYRVCELVPAWSLLALMAWVGRTVRAVAREYTPVSWSARYGSTDVNGGSLL